MTPRMVASYAKVMRENKIMALQVPGASIHLFPDAPDAGFVERTVEQTKEKSGCSMCGGTGRQKLMPGICDDCMKREAGVV